jgi:SAM-dependent methyltransferase
MSARMETLVRLGLLRRQQLPAVAVDVGCGDGEEVEWLRQRGTESHGIDLEPDYVAAARKRFPQASFAVADGYELADGIAPNSLDLILLSGSRVVDLGCYRESEIMELLDSYRSLLRDGGQIIVIENTDFSGEVEPAAGWHYKSEAEIRRLFPAQRIYFTRGYNRWAIRFLLGIPLLRDAMSWIALFLGRTAGAYVTYFIATQKGQRPWREAESPNSAAYEEKRPGALSE